MTRANLERLVWKHTPKDYRGKNAAGEKEVMHMAAGGGSTISTIASLTDDQLVALLPRAIRETL